MKKLLTVLSQYLLILCILSTSCNPSEEESISNTQSLTLTQTSYQTLEVVSVDLPHTTLQQQHYKGHIGTENIQVNHRQNQLHFIIPESLSAGTYPLVIDLEGSMHRTNIQIKAAAVIESPQHYLENFVATNFQYNQDKAWQKRATQELSNMSQQEKQNIAQFIQVNAALFQPKALKAHPPVQAKNLNMKTLNVGESFTVEVFSAETWNNTGIYLATDATYQFEGLGEWKDWYIDTDADGYSRWHMTLFNWLKRDTSSDWFTLMGSLDKSENFRIGKSLTKTMNKEGQLYCFANDAWGFYWNNYGSIQLKVTRVN